MEEAEDKKGVPSVRVALRRVWAPYSQVLTRSPALWNLLVSYVVISIVYSMGIQLYGPFLRSLVECDVLPEPGARFTGSAHCGDAEHVLAVAQAQEGSLVSMKLVVHAMAGPCLGTLADRLGRKSMLLASLGGFTTAFVLLVTVSARKAWHSDGVIFIVFFIEGATNAFDVVYMSMIADLTSAEDRAMAFAAYLACNAGGQVAAQLLSMVILRMCLESYAIVWLVFSMVLATDVIFVRYAMVETLTASSLSSRCGTMRGKMAFGAFLGPVKLVLSCPFLRYWLLSVVLASPAVGLASINASFSIAVYGWQPGDLQAYTWLSQLLKVGSLSFLSPYANRVGSPPAIVLVQVLLTVVAGFVQVFAPFSPAALLGPGYFLDALAFASSANAAFLSGHFGTEQQAQVHALQHLCSNLGASASIALFSSSLLFRPELRGRMAMRPFLLAFAMSVASGGVKASLALANLGKQSRRRRKDMEVELAV